MFRLSKTQDHPADLANWCRKPPAQRRLQRCNLVRELERYILYVVRSRSLALHKIAEVGILLVGLGKSPRKRTRLAGFGRHRAPQIGDIVVIIQQVAGDGRQSAIGRDRHEIADGRRVAAIGLSQSTGTLEALDLDRGSIGNDGGAGYRALIIKTDIREKLGQSLAELIPILKVRRRDYQGAFRPQNAGYFLKKRPLAFEASDQPEADDDIDGIVVQQDRVCVRNYELNVGCGVGRAGDGDGGFVWIDTNDIPGDLSDQTAAVALTAGNIENGLAATQLEGKEIHLMLFVPNSAGNARNVTLSIELELLRRLWKSVLILRHRRLTSSLRLTRG
ncbi:hypothetical protein OSH11_13175 [Kaistia dalseonensis]|nr:hypothetical protein [Kaistia dalseonensis]MCX5495661.1 hypothetical protein [Kaistia dalseonensis]